MRASTAALRTASCSSTAPRSSPTRCSNEALRLASSREPASAWAPSRSPATFTTVSTAASTAARKVASCAASARAVSSPAGQARPTGRPRGGDAGPQADDHAHDEQRCFHGRHVTGAL